MLVYGFIVYCGDWIVSGVDWYVVVGYFVVFFKLCGVMGSFVYGYISYYCDGFVDY